MDYFHEKNKDANSLATILFFVKNQAHAYG
jgi:hypothetical protein